MITKHHPMLRVNWNNRYNTSIENIAKFIMEVDKQKFHGTLEFKPNSDFAKYIHEITAVKRIIKEKLLNIKPSRLISINKSVLSKRLERLRDSLYVSQQYEIEAILQQIEFIYKVDTTPIKKYITSVDIAWTYYNALDDILSKYMITLKLILPNMTDRRKAWKRDFQNRLVKYKNKGMSDSKARRITYYTTQVSSKSRVKKKKIIFKIEQQLLKNGIIKDHAHRLSTFILHYI